MEPLALAQWLCALSSGALRNGERVVGRIKAYVPARAAVVGVGVQVHALPEAACLALPADVAAVAAIFGVVLRVHAGALAARLTAENITSTAVAFVRPDVYALVAAAGGPRLGARRVAGNASPVDAGVAGWADCPAAPAVVVVRAEIGAVPAQTARAANIRRHAGRVAYGANSIYASLTQRALVSATAAVQRVRAHIRADAAAASNEFTYPSRAHVAARAAVVRVVAQVLADAIAAGLTVSTRREAIDAFIGNHLPVDGSICYWSVFWAIATLGTC